MRLPRAQYRPYKSPNVSFISDFFPNFDTVYPDHAAADEVMLKNRHVRGRLVDEQVGKLLDALVSLEHRATTIVVVHADHGYQLG